MVVVVGDIISEERRGTVGENGEGGVRSWSVVARVEAVSAMWESAGGRVEVVGVRGSMLARI